MNFSPWPAVLSTFLVILQVVLVMAPGFWYTYKGVVETATRRKLSIISFNLLLPAFNFFNLAKDIDISTVTSYLPFAANTVLSNVLGMIMGWGSNWLVGTPRSLRYHVVAASGFGNLNSLPLLILSAMCQQDSLPFYQVLGDQCSSVGFGYIAVGTAATQIFTYPIAIWLLKKRALFAQPISNLSEIVVMATLQRNSPRLAAESSAPPVTLLVAETPGRAPPSPSGSTQIVDGTALALDPGAKPLQEAEVIGGQPGQDNGIADAATAATEAAMQQPQPVLQSFALDFSSGSSSSGGDDNRSERGSNVGSSNREFGGIERSQTRLEPPAVSLKAGSSSVPLEAPSHSGSSSSSSARPASFSSAASASRRLPGSQMNGEAVDSEAQLNAAAAGAALELEAGVRAQEGQPGMLQAQPDDLPAPRRPTRAQRYLRLVWTFTKENVLRMPCIGAVLGFIVGIASPIKNLLFPIQSATLGFLMGALFTIQAALIFVSSFVLGSVLSKGPGPGTRALGWRPLLSVVIIRMAALPLIGAVVVVGFVKLGWYKPLDPVYAFILLQQFCVPTANQMQNIASMSGNREREMGALIFWQYVVAFLAVPAWMVAYLWCLDHFNLFPGA